MKNKNEGAAVAQQQEHADGGTPTNYSFGWMESIFFEETVLRQNMRKKMS